MAWLGLVPKQVWALLGVLIVFGLLTEAVIFYGDQREKYGREHERTQWIIKYTAAIHDRDVAAADLIRTQAERDRAIRERDQARLAAVAHTQQEIINAPNLTAAYAAYVHLRDSLRNDAAANRSRAWADLGASIAAAPGPGTRVRPSGSPGTITTSGPGCDPEQLLSLGRCAGVIERTS